MKGFYFITDHTLSHHGNARDVKYAVNAGVKVVRYRHATAPDCLLYEEAAHLRTVCDEELFLVHRRVDIALAAGADGVHLEQEDMPIEVARKLLGQTAVIGITVGNLDEAKHAHKQGANYLEINPVFSDTEIDPGKVSGCKLISQIKERVAIPILARGGITSENALEVIEAGADCISASRAVLSGGNVQNDIERFQRMFT